MKEVGKIYTAVHSNGFAVDWASSDKEAVEAVVKLANKRWRVRLAAALTGNRWHVHELKLME